MTKPFRPWPLAPLALALLLPAGPASAQAVIKVNDDVNVKLGFLLQGQGDWTQSTANDSYAQNLFARRIRLLVGGQVAKNVSFFFETDSPNLGKVVARGEDDLGFHRPGRVPLVEALRRGDRRRAASC